MSEKEQNNDDVLGLAQEAMVLSLLPEEETKKKEDLNYNKRWIDSLTDCT